MSREAMQMALDMLNEIADDVYSDQKLEGVITALRQALEEKQEPLYWSVADGWVYADDTSQERVDEKAKREQEPVAWRWKERINSDFDSWVITSSEPPPYAIEQQPLYTSPPKRDLTCVCGAVWEGEMMVHPPKKREWVGLTDEEIDYQAKKDDHAVYFALGALWAEAKLKEKNT